MRRHLILPLVAASLLIFAVAYALYVQRQEPETPPPVAPAQTPFGNTVAGSGIVEPNTEASGKGTVDIGSQLAGVVTAVRVHIGQIVKAGDLLFELDARQATADIHVRQAALAVVQAQLRQAEQQPRRELLPPSEAQVAVAEAAERLTADVVARDRHTAARGLGRRSGRP